jgi:hypothetical protein
LPTQGIGWKYVPAGAVGTLAFTAPNLVAPATTATYQFRYFLNDGYTKVATSNNFVVGSGSSGTLIPAAQSCIIASLASSCNINYSWTVTNPVVVGGSSVTKPINVTVGSGDTGNNVPFAIKYSSETFYLYNNAVLLAQSTVTSSCAAGNFWNGTICTPGVSVDGSWSAWGACLDGGGGTPACGVPGTQTRTCTPPLNGGQPCSAIDGGNATQACTGSNATISVDLTTITAGDTVNLTWSSCNATTCTGTNFDTGGATSGSVPITPAATTTYTISCDDPLNSSASITVTVKRKPIFHEN